jgi:hypothetical protein
VISICLNLLVVEDMSAVESSGLSTLQVLIFHSGVLKSWRFDPSRESLALFVIASRRRSPFSALLLGYEFSIDWVAVH